MKKPKKNKSPKEIVKVTYTVPYGRDNSLNAWGDYDHIVIEFHSANRGLPDVKLVHKVPGITIAPRLLSGDEAGEVLLNFILQHAERKEITE